MVGFESYLGALIKLWEGGGDDEQGGSFQFTSGDNFQYASGDDFLFNEAA